jgi:hypothetical protein
MNDKRVSRPPSAQGAARSERLAEALRANLRRRKIQARGRAAADRPASVEKKPVKREPARD